MGYTVTELKVLAVLAVCGNVNRQKFNELCNTMKINEKARDRALQSLRDKGDVNPHAMRYTGDMYDIFIMVDAENGVVSTNKGGASVTGPGDSHILKVDTHPLNTHGRL